ncbi:uncharacterized protein LOC121733223 [Aricia agestis]|uniref:uncharacterized protein LOC121733223 n=1 Tax=Aricia agestis TaxID=91739 RepID=UPI001C20C0F2|nr:uncharacterized protein LOC121733223 [Aricia agestis]
MYRVVTGNHITAIPTVLTGGIIKMKKFGIIIFVLGVGIIFAETIPETETEKPAPKDSSVLEIVTYTSELENGKEDNQVLKATVQENNEANILLQELETEKSEEFDKAIENEQAIIDASIGAIENEHFPINFNWDGYDSIDDDYVPMQESDFYYKDLMERDPNEIMDTAAGFVPIPILKKRKQKPRRKFANRRYFRRPNPRPNPYRRHYYYYPYYRYYYPGSLRFY